MNVKQNDMVRKMARELVKNEVMPYDKEMDQKAEFPWHVMKEIAKYGVFGLTEDPAYGGAGLDSYAEAIFTEEMAYGSSSVAITLDAHYLASHIFAKYASKELKDRLMPDINSGNCIGCFALTEPSAGSDAAGIKSTAHLEGDEWVINGQKAWITNYSVSGFYLLAVLTDKTKGTRGISVIMVEKGNPGLKFGHKEDKMGIRGSDTGELFMSNCRVPKGNLIGELGKGFKYCMEVLDIGRHLIGAMSVGVIRRCMDESVKYANERKAFGQSIGKFEAISFKIADMKIAIETTSALTEKICELRENKQPFSVPAACLKAYGGQRAVWCADSAIQIHGGNGYSKEFVPERLLRDAKILEIGEGTTEIQKMIIGNSMLSMK
jgi:butyryl-CoA dehydrogenase